MAAIASGRVVRSGSAILGILNDCNSSREIEALEMQRNEVLNQTMGQKFRRRTSGAALLYMFG